MARTTKPSTPRKSVRKPAGGKSDATVAADRADPSGARTVTPGAPRPVTSASVETPTPSAPVASPPVPAPPAPEEAASASSVPTIRPSDKPRPSEPPAEADKPARAPAEVRSSSPGFLPLVLGGLVAGGIGFAVATFGRSSDGEAAAVVDPARIDAIFADVEQLKAAEVPLTDLSPLETAQGDLAGRLDAVALRLDAAEADLAAVSSTASRNAEAVPDAPVATTEMTGTLRADLDALSEEVAALSTDLSSQATALEENLTSRVTSLEEDLTGRVASLEELPARVASVEEGLAEARVAARDVEAEAEAMAKQAARNQVRLALQSGAPYAEQIALLDDVPLALYEMAETGVSAQAALIDDFPPLSREALREARSAAPEAGVGSLFRNALNPRSLEPREGDDPDAVLSRAEAAVQSGDLDAALTEIEALPSEARAVLDPWTTRARARARALAAADDYLQDG